MRLKSTSIKSTRLVLSTSQYYTIYDVTRSHLTLFPVFSRPFGLSSLQILYYIYKLNNKHYQCNIRSPVCHQGIVDWRLRWSGVLLWVEKWPSSLRLWPFTDQISVEVFSGNLQLAFERRESLFQEGIKIVRALASLPTQGYGGLSHCIQALDAMSRVQIPAEVIPRQYPSIRTVAVAPVFVGVKPLPAPLRLSEGLGCRVT